MSIPKRHLDRVLGNVFPSDIIGQYVKLRRRGKKDAGEWIGLCPFHNEHTPSFTVTDSKNFFFCFGCGRFGRTHTFLMLFLGMSYEEAVCEIADHYKIQIPCGPTRVTKKKMKDRTRRQKRLEQNEKKGRLFW